MTINQMKQLNVGDLIVCPTNFGQEIDNNTAVGMVIKKYTANMMVKWIRMSNNENFIPYIVSYNYDQNCHYFYKVNVEYEY